MKSKLLSRFGNKVREERLKRGYSQEQLADLAGLHRTYSNPKSIVTFLKIK